MATITLAGAKGGVGKSTLTIHLASEWMRRGHRVLVVDADPQGSALAWSEVAAEAGHPAPDVVAVGDNLRQALPGLSEGYDMTVVDLPGRQSKRVAGALALSDFAALPCQPMPADLWAIAETVDAVKLTQEVRPDLQAMIVANGLANTTLARTARASLESAGLPVLAASLGRRVAFAEAMAAGQGVTSYAPGSTAAVELMALVDEIEVALGLRSASDVA